MLAITALTCGSLAQAESWKDESGKGQHRERKEVFYDGPCKIEREWKKNGEYKEKRECKPRREFRRDERKEKFHEGPCKIEREWKEDGEYKEERECKHDRGYRRVHPQPDFFYYQ